MLTNWQWIMINCSKIYRKVTIVCEMSNNGTSSPVWHYIGLFKMFSRWIWGIFNIQIQSDKRHKLMLFMFQNKDKDFLGSYKYGCDPFCVSLLTDRHLKVRSNSILFTFSDKGALTSARDS